MSTGASARRKTASTGLASGPDGSGRCLPLRRLIATAAMLVVTGGLPAATAATQIDTRVFIRLHLGMAEAQLIARAGEPDRIVARGTRQIGTVAGRQQPRSPIRGGEGRPHAAPAPGRARAPVRPAHGSHSSGPIASGLRPPGVRAGAPGRSARRAPDRMVWGRREPPASRLGAGRHPRAPGVPNSRTVLEYDFHYIPQGTGHDRYLTVVRISGGYIAALDRRQLLERDTPSAALEPAPSDADRTVRGAERVLEAARAYQAVRERLLEAAADDGGVAPPLYRGTDEAGAAYFGDRPLHSGGDQ